MSVVAVIVGGIGLLLAWYFFAPQKATQAQVSGGVQTGDIVVRGGYSPNPVTGGLLSPMIAAAAMVPSSISVALNAARLDRIAPPPGGAPGPAAQGAAAAGTAPGVVADGRGR